MWIGRFKGVANNLNPSVFCNLFTLLLNCLTISSDKYILILLLITFCLGFLFKKLVFPEKQIKIDERAVEIPKQIVSKY